MIKEIVEPDEISFFFLVVYVKSCYYLGDRLNGSC